LCPSGSRWFHNSGEQFYIRWYDNNLKLCLTIESDSIFRSWQSLEPRLLKSWPPVLSVWLLTALRPAQEVFTYMETSPLPDLWAGRNLYRATPAVIRGFGFSGLIRQTVSFRRLLRHTGGYGGPTLTVTSRVWPLEVRW
jgi:hypothetical protein